MSYQNVPWGVPGNGSAPAPGAAASTPSSVPWGQTSIAAPSLELQAPVLQAPPPHQVYAQRALAPHATVSMPGQVHVALPPVTSGPPSVQRSGPLESAAPVIGNDKFTGYSDDQVARELLKRLVQAVGRAFYEDSKVRS